MVLLAGDRTIISLAEWKALARRGEMPPPDAILRKQYVADQVKAEGGDSRKVSFTISTGAVDRDRDTVSPDGWRLDAYRKNPVVLWAHASRDLPIARAEAVTVSAGQLKARAEFVAAEDYPFADTVYRLLKGGFLKATSVGFLPNFAKAKWDDARMGYDFGEQELLEFSVVPVPANPEALMDAKAAGIDLAPLKGWAERTLDEVTGPGLWVPKEQAAAAVKILSAPRIFVPVQLVKAIAAKAGRAISAANEERLQTALTAIEDSATGIEAAAELIEEVLGLGTPAQGDEPEGPGDAPAGKGAVLFLQKEPTYNVDPNVVKAAVMAAVSEAVLAQVNAARGRLD